ncbi:hypothetical protein M513_01619 [Trichuris suis]|uniref:Uncharacterized protein n=1 Tax=Trichuris suis TaxID=68888 RepID=A0A085MJX0_9BILA|nr:hypothetical protein M513_01619 [Trichuris suis]
MSSSANSEFTYENMFGNIEKTIRLELLTNNPSEEAKNLVKLMSKLVRSESVINVVKTSSNPISAANALQIAHTDMNGQNIVDELLSFFNASNEAAQLAQELIRSSEAVDKITSAWERELSESSDETLDNVMLQSRDSVTDEEERDEQKRSCIAESSL